MKKHTLIGFELLRSQHDIPVPAAHVALQHHERFDGSGYPRGLKGEEIHLFGRISAVADVYDAMTTNRAYRAAHLPQDAFELIIGGSGTMFDPVYVQHFVASVAIFPVGTLVRLKSGEQGVVCRNTPNLPQRPTVRVLHAPSGERVAEPYEVNLANVLTEQIEAVLA